jgi:cytochrome c oxidase cbb3-type subunit 3
MLLVLGVAGCDRMPGTAGPRTGEAFAQASSIESTIPGARPGIAPQTVLGAVRNPFAGDPQAIAIGRQLFTGYNCAGCHSAYAGGGMGPNLRDTVWIYGGSDAQLFSTIAEGRPNGMPAWGAKVAEDQIWQIIAYLRTLGTNGEPVKPPTPSQGS